MCVWGGIKVASFRSGADSARTCFRTGTTCVCGEGVGLGLGRKGELVVRTDEQGKKVIYFKVYPFSSLLTEIICFHSKKSAFPKASSLFFAAGSCLRYMYVETFFQLESHMTRAGIRPSGWPYNFVCNFQMFRCLKSIISLCMSAVPDLPIGWIG